MKELVKEPNLDTYFDKLYARYYNWLAYLYKRDLAIASDKEIYKQICIEKSRAVHLFYISDNYTKSIFDIFKENYNLKRPMQEIVDKVQESRGFWWKQQNMGTEYGTDYIPIYDFVKDKRDSTIIKHIVKCIANLKFFANNLKENPKAIVKLTGSNVSKDKVKDDIVVSSFKWKKTVNPEAQMNALYHWLVQEQCINKTTKLGVFKSAFRNKEIKEYIVWKTDLGNLTYLLDELAKYLFDLPDNIESIIKSKELTTKDKRALSNWINPKLRYCFRDRNKNIFSKDAIKNAKNHYQNQKLESKKPSKGKLIDKLIKDLKTIQ